MTMRSEVNLPDHLNHQTMNNQWSNPSSNPKGLSISAFVYYWKFCVERSLWLCCIQDVWRNWPRILCDTGILETIIQGLSDVAEDNAWLCSRFVVGQACLVLYFFVARKGEAISEVGGESLNFEQFESNVLCGFWLPSYTSYTHGATVSIFGIDVSMWLRYDGSCLVKLDALRILLDIM